MYIGSKEGSARGKGQRKQSRGVQGGVAEKLGLFGGAVARQRCGSCRLGNPRFWHASIAAYSLPPLNSLAVGRKHLHNGTCFQESYNTRRSASRRRAEDGATHASIKEKRNETGPRVGERRLRLNCACCTSASGRGDQVSAGRLGRRRARRTAINMAWSRSYGSRLRGGGRAGSAASSTGDWGRAGPRT